MALEDVAEQGSLYTWLTIDGIPAKKRSLLVPQHAIRTLEWLIDLGHPDSGLVYLHEMLPGKEQKEKLKENLNAVFLPVT